MITKLKYTVCLIAGFLLMTIQPVQAAGQPQSSLLSNPIAITLLILMLLLLIVIGLLGYVLLGTAEFKQSKDKEENSRSALGTVVTIALLLAGNGAMAQDPTVSSAATQTIGGMSPTTFYIMAAVLFLELSVILVLLINIKMLLKVEKEKIAVAEETKKATANWWSRLNRFRPVEQEADIDLGHDYDGIRELDNRLPPWWLYSFYISIVFAGIYMWRFHVTHSGPSSKQEFEYSMAKAELKIKEYLKEKGESVDENTVTLLTSADDIAEGKKIYIASCASCHKTNGAGDVGPNLTDEYWLHGNDLKSIFKTIRYGINAMPQWQNSYSNKQIAQVTSYLKTLEGTKPENPKAPQGQLYKEEGSKPAAVSDSASEKKPM